MSILLSMSYIIVNCTENSRKMTRNMELTCPATAKSNNLYQVATGDGHCYMIHNVANNYAAAEAQCTLISGGEGHLVHIRDTIQAEIVKNLIKVNNSLMHRSKSITAKYPQSTAEHPISCLTCTVINRKNYTWLDIELKNLKPKSTFIQIQSNLDVRTDTES